MSLGAERTKELIQNFKEQGTSVAIDPGSTSFIESFGAEKFLDAIQRADIIFPNQDEFELLGKENLGNLFAEVLITKGDQGAEALGFGQVRAKQVKSVDPTGAGDAFAAKYIFERLSGLGPFEALKSANDFAADAVTQLGGQPSYTSHLFGNPNGRIETEYF